MAARKQVTPRKVVAAASTQGRFYGWATACLDLEADEWPVAPKRTVEKKDSKGLPSRVKVTPRPPIKITDMHTMQLVNSIKWCVNLAHRQLAGFTEFATSKAELLATVPQWRELLEEGKRRKLTMMVWCDADGTIVDYHEWVQEALVAIGMYALTKQ